MAYLIKGRKPRKRREPVSLPLFEYAEANRIRDLPLSARRFVRRWGMSPSTARAVAELAGFPTERD
jgi:hypothetical protein